MNGVSKRFRKGELFDTLRDALPALAARLVGSSKRGAANSCAFWALQDISLAVGRGEALGIIGHNGAGKSTILKLLCGLLKPTKGTIEVNGSLSALIEVGAGFHPDLSGRENIYLNGAILGLSRAEVRRKFDQIVDFSGLADFLDTPVKRYSTGMYARLGFSIAAHIDPDILIVDEVLSVGDYLFQRRCMERMEEIVNRGAAIIFVSHNLDVVARFCDRAILLDHGRVLVEGAPQDVIAAYTDAARTVPSNPLAKDAFVSRLVVRGKDGPTVSFEPGDDAWIDVDVTANRRCERLSLTVYLRDHRNIDIFYASMLRLRLPSLTFHAGETKSFTIHLQLHLAGGAFHVGVVVYRYDIDMKSPTDDGVDATACKVYDDRYPMATLLVNSPVNVGSVANLYPEFQMNTEVTSKGRLRTLPEPIM